MTVWGQARRTHRRLCRCVRARTSAPHVLATPPSGVARDYDESDGRSCSNVLKIIVISVATSAVNALIASNEARHDDFLAAVIKRSESPLIDVRIDVPRDGQFGVFVCASRTARDVLRGVLDIIIL